MMKKRIAKSRVVTKTSVKKTQQHTAPITLKRQLKIEGALDRVRKKALIGSTFIIELSI